MLQTQMLVSPQTEKSAVHVLSGKQGFPRVPFGAEMIQVHMHNFFVSIGCCMFLVDV